MPAKKPQKKSLKKKIQNGIRKIKSAKKKSTKKRTSAAKKQSPAKTPLKTQAKKAISKITRKPRKNIPVTAKKDVAVQSVKETVEVSKFTAVQTPQEEITRYNLPFRYYDDRIVALSRDPWWIHAYWDLSEGKISGVLADIPLHERDGVNWILRVYDVTDVRDFRGNNANSYFDIGIHFDANNWYINVNSPETEWCIEIGMVTRTGVFYPVARSNIVKTPYFGISDIIDEEWACADDDYYRVLGIYDLGKSSLQRRKRLEEIVKGQISSGAFSGGISSLFSMRQKKQRKFFLEVWTELILYGRTEPTADVTVCGKKINLRKDGTFTFRYALPEGDFRYDVEATSEDNVDTLRRVPAVKRFEIK